MGYDVAQICREGHVITMRANENSDARMAFCRRCGAPTIMACEACGTQIRGGIIDPQVITLGGRAPTAPKFCHGCGAPYPWTIAALEAARDLVADAEDLTDEERAQLSASLDDLVRDTAKTEVAAGRFKRLAAKAGVETAGALRTVLVSVMTEAAKKSVGL